MSVAVKGGLPKGLVVVAQVLIHVLFDGVLEFAGNGLKVVVVVRRVGNVVVVVIWHVDRVLSSIGVVKCVVVMAGGFVRFIVGAGLVCGACAVVWVASVSKFVSERSGNLVALNGRRCLVTVYHDLHGGMNRLFRPPVNVEGRNM